MRITLTAALCVGLTGLGLAAADQARASESFPLISHRGLYSATVPENSKDAVRDALEAGADGVEVDIRLTSDDKVIAMHDPTLDRTTTCTGNVSDRTYDDIRTNCTLDSGEKVPNLYELAWIFERYADSNDQFWVHTKFEASSAVRSSAAAARDKYGGRPQTVLLAVEDDYLDDWNKWSYLKFALIFNQADVDQGGREAWEGGFDYAVPYRVTVTPALVQLAQSTGSDVYGVEGHFITGVAEAMVLGMDGLLADTL